VRDAVEVVDRAVERIDVPPQTAAAYCRGSLLGDDRVIRASCAQVSNDRVLGTLVGIGDEIGGAGLRA